MAVRKVSVEEALRTITAADVRDACDLLAPVAQRTVGCRWRTQRPLWASTGVKNQDYPDTLYIGDLAPDAVMQAVTDAGVDLD